MKFKLLLCFLLLILIIPLANAADFNLTGSYQWLIASSQNGNYGNSVFTTSFAALALKAGGMSSQAEKALDWINSQKSNLNCWPKTECKIKDSSLAMLTLNELVEETFETEKWLADAQSEASSTGNWYLQVATQTNGTCKITYNRSGINIVRNVIVNKGYFPSCNNQTWFDLNSCLELNLIKNNPGIELDIDCDSLGGSTIISIVYKVSNTYYLTEEEHASKTKLRVNNGCFGVTRKSTCNYESSLYANLALKKVGSNSNTLFYLKENYDNTNPLHNALLYLITGDTSYADKLISQQKSDGSWQTNVYTTSLSILALKQGSYPTQITEAKEWLKEKQHSSGSWNSNILDTAITLYAAFSEEAQIEESYCGDNVCDSDEDETTCPEDCEEIKETYCGDGTCSSDESETSCQEDCGAKECNKDGFCDTAFEETYLNCPEDCSAEPCNNDKICDSEIGETSENCLSDCPKEVECGDGICDEDETITSCPSDCKEIKEPAAEKKGGFPFWLIILIIILLIGGYFFYRKFYKKPKKKEIGFFKPGEKPSYTPYTSQLRAREKPVAYGRFRAPPRIQPRTVKSKIEEELDKSISEAKKLLKRK